MSLDRRPDEDVVRALFPRRSAVVDRWASEVRDLVDTTIVGGGPEAMRAGLVFEFAVGFDLSSTVPYRDALANLYPETCRDLLLAIGYEAIDGDRRADGELDLRKWVRSVDLPSDLDVLLPCAATVEQLYRVMPMLDIDRGWFEDRFGQAPLYRGDSAAAALVTDLWQRYVASGREQLRTAGTVEAVRPRFHDRAIGDLVIGRTLVDIKAKVNPLQDLERDLTQLLRYVLFDQQDSYRFDTVMLYLGCQGTAVQCSIPDLTETVSTDLADLRHKFARLQLEPEQQ